SLIKFGFTFNRKFGAKYKLLRSFLANWKGRHTMLLQIWPVNYILGHEKEVNRLYELIEYYEAKGIVKKIDWEINWYNESEEFNWIKKRCFR
ncbi:22706_t:CDS:1, partial [Rhizophagus irregularis]